VAFVLAPLPVHDFPGSTGAYSPPLFPFRLFFLHACGRSRPPNFFFPFQLPLRKAQRSSWCALGDYNSSPPPPALFHLFLRFAFLPFPPLCLTNGLFFYLVALSTDHSLELSLRNPRLLPITLTYTASLTVNHHPFPPFFHFSSTALRACIFPPVSPFPLLGTLLLPPSLPFFFSQFYTDLHFQFKSILTASSPHSCFSGLLLKRITHRLPFLNHPFAFRLFAQSSRFGPTLFRLFPAFSRPLPFPCHLLFFHSSLLFVALRLLEQA